jgi:hypothetical protein
MGKSNIKQHQIAAAWAQFAARELILIRPNEHFDECNQYTLLICSNTVEFLLKYGDGFQIDSCLSKNTSSLSTKHRRTYRLAAHADRFTK